MARKKRKKPVSSEKRKAVWASLCCALVVLVALVWIWWPPGRDKHFGIVVPEGFGTHGIDISQYQGEIDWERALAPQDSDIRISFVFMRATMGLRKDKKFGQNWQKASPYKVTRGAYLYFHPDKDGAAQADLFIKTVGSLKKCYPPVVDVEHTYRQKPAVVRARLTACLKRLHNHYGIRPVIYTYTTFYRDYLGSDFDAYPLWIAHYKQEEAPAYINRSWDIWQHSEEGVLQGIGEKVDFNVMHDNSVLHEYGGRANNT